MAEARFAQQHQRALLDPAAPVSGFGVAHDLARVADHLQIAGDDFVERRSFGAAISTMPFRGAASATAATTVATSSAAMGWNRTGGSLTMFRSALESAMSPRNSMNSVARIMI